MQTKQLICINCPLGCPLTVAMDDKNQITDVTGNTCPRGAQYAKKELTAPTRIVTSIVRVSGSTTGAVAVSCKTRNDIPKDKIFAVVKELKEVVSTAPIAIGDVLKTNVAGTGVDVIATKAIL